MEQLLEALTAIAKEKANSHRRQSDSWQKVVELLPSFLKTFDRPNNEIEKTYVAPAIATKPRLSSREAAHYLGLSEGTLAVWRVKGEGPQFNKIGTRVMYSRDVLDTYLRDRTYGHTAKYNR